MSKGTVPITGTITTTNDLDTYPTHWDKFVLGGFRTVANASQRDAITTERRSEGMQVFVRDIKQLHQLIGGTDNTKWVTILTVGTDNKITVNNDLNLQKYVIEGAPTPLLPNAVALNEKADGYLVTTSGVVSTTAGIPPGSLSISPGKLLTGDNASKAIEIQTINTNNLPANIAALPSQKYLIEGSSTSILPNATALGSKTDGYLVNNNGNLNSVSFSKLDAASYVINTKPTDMTLLFPNAQYLDQLGSDGIVKLESVSGLLKIATPDTDYATVVTLNKIAAQAQGSADAAAASATAAADSANIADARATTAGSEAGAAAASAAAALSGQANAQNAASAAANSAAAAVVSAASSAQYAGNSADAAGEALDHAEAAFTSKNNAANSAAAAAGSANAAQNTYNTLVTTGLNAFPNSGNVNFQGYRGINAADGIDAADFVTVEQLGTVSKSAVNSVSGTAGQIKSTGGQTPILSLIDTGVTAGDYFFGSVLTDGRLSKANGGNIDFQGFRGVNAADGVNATDLVTVQQLSTAGGAFVKSVSGTAAQIKSTGGQTPVLSLIDTGVTPGDYFFGSVVTDGRLTKVNSDFPVYNISGTGINALVDFAGNASLSLANTGITAGTYTLATIKATADGRLTSATSNTLAGTAGRITISAAPTMVADLATVGSAGSRTIGQYQAWDAYGRITGNEQASLNAHSGIYGGSTTVCASTGVYYTANLPTTTLTNTTNFTWAGGTANIICTATNATLRLVHICLGIKNDALMGTSLGVILQKNGSTTFAAVQCDVSGAPVTIIGSVVLGLNDYINIRYNASGANVTYTTMSATITII